MFNKLKTLAAEIKENRFSNSPLRPQRSLDTPSCSTQVCSINTTEDRGNNQTVLGQFRNGFTLSDSSENSNSNSSFDALSLDTPSFATARSVTSEDPDAILPASDAGSVSTNHTTVRRPVPAPRKRAMRFKKGAESVHSESIHSSVPDNTNTSTNSIPADPRLRALHDIRKSLLASDIPFNDKAPIFKMGAETVDSLVADFANIWAHARPVTLSNAARMLMDGNMKMRKQGLFQFLEYFNLAYVSCIETIEFLVQIIPQFLREYVIDPLKKYFAYEAVSDQIQRVIDMLGTNVGAPIAGFVLAIATLILGVPINYLMNKINIVSVFSKSFVQSCRDIKFIDNAIPVIEKALTNVLELFNLKLPNPDRDALKLDEDETILYNNYLVDIASKISANPAIIMTNPVDICAIVKRVDELQKKWLAYGKTRNVSYINPTLTNLVRLKEQILRISHTLSAQINTKRQVTVVYLYGESGVGKSELQQRIIRELSRLHGRELTAYTRNAGDAFWSSYQQNDVIIYDDFAANTSSMEGNELMNIYSSAPYALNVADLSEKGKYFNSRYVIICSNTARPIFDNLSNNDALERRRDFLIEVTNPGFKDFKADNPGAHPTTWAGWKDDCSHLDLQGMAKAPEGMHYSKLQCDGADFKYDVVTLCNAMKHMQDVRSQEFALNLQRVAPRINLPVYTPAGVLYPNAPINAGVDTPGVAAQRNFTLGETSGYADGRIQRQQIRLDAQAARDEEAIRRVDTRDETRLAHAQISRMINQSVGIRTNYIKHIQSLTPEHLADVRTNNSLPVPGIPPPMTLDSIYECLTNQGPQTVNDRWVAHVADNCHPTIDLAQIALTLGYGEQHWYQSDIGTCYLLMGSPGTGKTTVAASTSLKTFDEGLHEDVYVKNIQTIIKLVDAGVSCILTTNEDDYCHFKAVASKDLIEKLQRRCHMFDFTIRGIFRRSTPTPEQLAEDYSRYVKIVDCNEKKEVALSEVHRMLSRDTKGTRFSGFYTEPLYVPMSDVECHVNLQCCLQDLSNASFTSLISTCNFLKGSVRELLPFKSGVTSLINVLRHTNNGTAEDFALSVCNARVPLNTDNRILFECNDAQLMFGTLNGFIICALVTQRRVVQDQGVFYFEYRTDRGVDVQLLTADEIQLYNLCDAEYEPIVQPTNAWLMFSRALLNVLSRSFSMLVSTYIIFENGALVADSPFIEVRDYGFGGFRKSYKDDEERMEFEGWRANKKIQQARDQAWRDTQSCVRELECDDPYGRDRYDDYDENMKQPRIARQYNGFAGCGVSEGTNKMLKRGGKTMFESQLGRKRTEVTLEYETEVAKLERRLAELKEIIVFNEDNFNTNALNTRIKVPRTRDELMERTVGIGREEWFKPDDYESGFKLRQKRLQKQTMESGFKLKPKKKTRSGYESSAASSVSQDAAELIAKLEQNPVPLTEYLGSHDYESCLDAGHRATLEKIIRNKCSIRVSADKKSHNQGLFLKGIHGVTNYHATDGDGSEFIVCDSDGNLYTARVISVNKIKDLAFFEVTSKNFPLKPSIIKHLRNKRDHTELRCPMALVTQTGKTPLVYVLQGEGITKVRISGNEHIGIKTRVCTQIAVGNNVSQPGDCGSPVIAINPNMPRKLLGFHMSANAQECCATNLMFEDLPEEIGGLCYESAIDRCGPNMDLTKVPVVGGWMDPCLGEYEVEDSTFIPVGVLRDPTGRIFSRYENGKSAYMPSPLAFDKPLMQTFEPAIMSRWDDRNKEGIDPLVKNVKKWDKVRPEWDQDFINEKMVEMADWFSGQITTEEHVVKRLTKMEAINRFTDSNYSNPIDPKTSAGFPYTFFPGVRRKSPMIVQQEEGTYVIDMNHEYGRALNSNIDLLVSSCAKGVPPIVTFMACLKDETRPLAKIFEVKTRSIVASPLHFTIAHRQYLHSIGTALIGTRNNHPLKVGVAPNTSEWETIYNYITEYNEYGWGADVGSFDAWVPPEMIRGLGHFYNCIYNNFGIPSAYDDRVRLSLYEILAYPIISCRGTTFMSQGGMVSGQPHTAIDDSLIMLFYYFLCWCDSIPDDGKYSATFSSFMQNVKIIVQGDDNLVLPRQAVLKFFNYITCKDWFRNRLGADLTPETKGQSDVPYVHINTLTFLKRYFYRNEYGRISGRLREDAFDKMLQWCRSTSQNYSGRWEGGRYDADALVSTMETAQYEASLGPKDFYKFLQQHLFKCCKRLGWTFNNIGPHKTVFNRIYFGDIEVEWA